MILLFCLVTSRTIDIGKVIHTSIMATLRNHKYGLYFPSLITMICKNAGVKWDDNETIVWPQNPIIEMIILESTNDPPSEAGFSRTTRTITSIQASYDVYDHT